MCFDRWTGNNQSGGVIGIAKTPSRMLESDVHDKRTIEGFCVGVVARFLSALIPLRWDRALACPRRPPSKLSLDNWQFKSPSTGLKLPTTMFPVGVPAGRVR